MVDADNTDPNAPRQVRRDDVLEIGSLLRLQWEPSQDNWVLLYPEGMVKLAGPTAEILRRVNGTTPVDKILAELREAFGGQDVDEDALSFLTEAWSRGWVQPAGDHPEMAVRRIVDKPEHPLAVTPMPEGVTRPHWLLCELTYRCPLQCPYCSNPVEIAKYQNELTTEEWKKVMREAREMGAIQLGFSGGEPLVRKDLEELIAYSTELGFYSNLITSGVGMDEERVKRFKEAGLDHIQISFQASNEELNNYLGGTDSFKHKLEMARIVKKYGYPMVLNIVIHRQNIDQIRDILDMCVDLQGDYVELASTQYYGWSKINAEHLLPTRAQLTRAEAVAHEYQERMRGKMRVIYVVPDYFEDRPKACMNGWGSIFLTMAPDGTALPCHAAGQLPGISFPNARDFTIPQIWNESDAFNHFRGFDWMKDPCKACPEKTKDFGGCRCQAYMLTGDMYAADPVCGKSAAHGSLVAEVDEIERRAEAGVEPSQPIIFRNMRTSKQQMKAAAGDGDPADAEDLAEVD